MYPQGTVLLALHLSSLGVVDRESARICGVSVRAVRHGLRQLAEGVVCTYVKSVAKHWPCLSRSMVRQEA
jgi:hypothetical protein